MAVLAPALAGILCAAAVALAARASGMERERAFYPMLVIAIALLYEAFAASAGSWAAAAAELTPCALFVVVACAAYRADRRLAITALLAHGMFDGVHALFIDNPGVPAWWPAYCLAYDVTQAILATRLRSRPAPRPGPRAGLPRARSRPTGG
jgi:hypothetical protein